MSIMTFFETLTQSVVEARRRQAAYNVAQNLRHNPDFRHWSFEEIYHHVLDEDSPVGIDKKPLGNS